MSRLAHKVLEYVRAVRKSPALAVGAGLDELARTADTAFDGGWTACMAPNAPNTWQARDVLRANQTETVGQDILIGEPVELVGAQTTLLLVDTAQGLIRPPPEAIDVRLQLQRKDEFANTMQPRQNGNIAGGGTSRDNYANLPFFDTTLPRLLGILAEEADPILTLSWRWNVPLTTVAAFGWGDVQLTMGFFVRPKNPRR